MIEWSPKPTVVELAKLQATVAAIDDLAIAILATDRGGGPIAVKDEAHEFFLHVEHSPDQDEGRL